MTANDAWSGWISPCGSIDGTAVNKILFPNGNIGIGTRIPLKTGRGRHRERPGVSGKRSALQRRRKPVANGTNGAISYSGGNVGSGRRAGSEI